MKYINTVDIIKEEVAIIKKLNLKTDIIFRTFFSRKGNEYFLIDFLNALLNVEIKSIKIRLDKHRDYEIIDGITWYFIELPKFRKSNPNMENKLNQWLAIIDDYDKEMIELAEKNNQIIEKAKIELGTLTGDEEIKRIAELKEKWEMDYNSAVQNAEERGLTQGRAEGHVAGIAEEKRNIAKKLISLNIPKEKIIEITGLIEEEIEKLKEE